MHSHQSPSRGWLPRHSISDQESHYMRCLVMHSARSCAHDVQLARHRGASEKDWCTIPSEVITALIDTDNRALVVEFFSEFIREIHTQEASESAEQTLDAHVPALIADQIRQDVHDEHSWFLAHSELMAHISRATRTATA
ncbi:hypothetical protein [Arthrobacter woluwensis]|uniref:hypothetical protein n=1 Tax=Arthrobacter woluwensis TaxID=156980 RepID=UPI0038005FE3